MPNSKLIPHNRSILTIQYGQNFTLATMDNCKKFAVIVSITTICSYINFSHSIWQRPAPKQLWARLTRTLSLVWGRTDKFCQVELNALKEKGGKPPLVSSQRELKIIKAFQKSYCWKEPKWKYINTTLRGRNTLKFTIWSAYLSMLSKRLTQWNLKL